jgi:hypothetical protein
MVSLLFSDCVVQAGHGSSEPSSKRGRKKGSARKETSTIQICALRYATALMPSFIISFPNILEADAVF